MVKRRSTRRRGGYLSWNPFNWGKPDPSIPAPSSGVTLGDSAPPAAATTTAMGGRKRKTRRRGGRRHSKASKIYGTR